MALVRRQRVRTLVGSYLLAANEQDAHVAISELPYLN